MSASAPSSAGCVTAAPSVSDLPEPADEGRPAGLSGAVDPQGRVRIVLADGTTVMADLSDIAGLDTAGTVPLSRPPRRPRHRRYGTAPPRHGTGLSQVGSDWLCSIGFLFCSPNGDYMDHKS